MAAHVSRTCRDCGESFTYLHGVGAFRRYCRTCRAIRDRNSQRERQRRYLADPAAREQHLERCRRYKRNAKARARAARRPPPF